MIFQRVLSIYLFLPAALSSIRNSQDDSSIDCDSLPSQSDFFSSQQLDMVCHHRKMWMEEREARISIEMGEKPTKKQASYLKAIEKCTRENCVRAGVKRPKRATPRKTIRREVRMMSREERKAVFEAMNILKNTEVDNITAWDLHTLVHYPDSAPGAHWGPAFLPWHREFLRQFEIALQKERDIAFLPYWDSTLDQGLPRPADSVLWSDELLGNGNGYVKTGPFKDWETNVLMPLSEVPVKRLYRSTGGRPNDRLLSPRDIEWIESRGNYSDLTFCHDKTFESMHGLSHVWVGGFMFVIRVSPNDPSFYMHHAFVDSLWERFRQKQQTRDQRESEYAKKTCSKLQQLDAQMKPFGITNRDGLSNRYTDEWYEYEPIRHCSSDRPNCDSTYLFCDEKQWVCRSKVVLGGNCTGFEGSAICYKSTCIKGSCRLPPRVELAKRLQKTPSNSAEEPHKESTSRLARGVVWTKTLLIDEDGRGIRDTLASVTVDYGEGPTATVYMNHTLEYPELPGMVYIPLPKVHGDDRLRITVTARDAYGRYCQPQCYNSTVERHHVCEGTLTLSSSLSHSTPISFTHDPNSRRFLDADLSVHPRLVSVTPPYLVFACSRKMITSGMIWSIANSEKPPRDSEEHVFIRVSLSRNDMDDLEVESSSLLGRDTWKSPVQFATSPVDPSILFVRVPNPELHPEGVSVRVSFLHHGSRIGCIVKCTSEDGWSEECDGIVSLHQDPTRSSESTFSSDPSVLPLLGWKMQFHPSTWTHRVPYLSFTC
ncbi:tyr-6 [Pristionchus pacificus]|nr:tyr-6 [Pristionchus pacificus]